MANKEDQWQPIETCPDNTSVLFYFHGAVVMGCMEHDTPRMGGYNQDHFWGGPWALDADDSPPTRWAKLPDPPEVDK